MSLCNNVISHGIYHHHKHPGLGHLARSVSRVKVALSIISSVSQLFSFHVGCKAHTEREQLGDTWHLWYIKLGGNNSTKDPRVGEKKYQVQNTETE
jgi:hypothetical protein